MDEYADALTLPEVAALLRVSPRTVRRYRAGGDDLGLRLYPLPSVRRLLFSPAEVRRYLAARKAEAERRRLLRAWRPDGRGAARRVREAQARLKTLGVG